jgi:methylase of polypeptide subunit release factors
MPLADISRFASRQDLLRDLGRALQRIGISIASAAPVVRAASAVPPAQRKPIRSYYLRKMRDAKGHAMRMLMFGDPVTADEAKVALGSLVDPLVDAGVLVRRDDGSVVSPLILSVLDDLYIFSDDLGHDRDAVMGFGETTIALSAAALPRAPIGRALDLGCGSGTSGILFTSCAKEVVATDINARAVALARANAALNDRRLDVREGDRFAPVEGETFDLIVSQPPFVAKPEGVEDAVFLYGGERGDELSLSILRDTPKHLSLGGRAVLFIEWPVYGDKSVEARVREAVGAGPNVLVLEAPGSGVDVVAVAYAAGIHPDLGAEFEAAALLRRQHFERMGIRDLTPSLVVIERIADGARGWTSTLRTEPFSRLSFSSERIDKVIAARALAKSRDRVMAATLRVPERTIFTQEQVGPGAEVPSTLSARFAPFALLPPLNLTAEMLGLLTFVHEAKTAREGIEQFAEALEMPLDRALEEGGQAVVDALIHGSLEIAGA